MHERCHAVKSLDNERCRIHIQHYNVIGLKKGYAQMGEAVAMLV